MIAIIVGVLGLSWAPSFWRSATGTPAMSHFDIKQSQKSMTRITRSFKISTNLPFKEVSFQQAKGVRFLGSEALSLQLTLVLGVTQLGAISGVLHWPSPDSFGIP